MQLAVLLILATAFVMSNEISAAGRECEADHQCDNGYCYLMTGVCTPCTDCPTYLRSPSKWRSCARGHKDCGGCLDGYEFEVLADGSTKDYCVPKKTSRNKQKSAEQSLSFWFLLAVPVGVIVIVGIGIFVFYRRVKSRGSCGSAPNPEDPPPPQPGNDPPPSYDSSIPLLEGVPLASSFTFVEKEGDSLQQAIPFVNPQPPYGFDGAVDEPPEFLDHLQHVEMYDPSAPSSQVSSEEEEGGAHAISPPHLEDEDTMPSDWTPGTCYPERSPSPIAEEEQQQAPAPSIPSSSTSLLSNPEILGEGNNGVGLNDSGVSCTCSRQSGLSCDDCSNGAGSLETVPIQGGVVGNRGVMLGRHRSEEDINALAEFRAYKRLRYDSGSASTQSLQPF